MPAFTRLGGGSIAQRVVEPEWLDELPPDAPEALGSRRDLRRLNFWMGNSSTMARALGRTAVTRAKPARPQLVELGAGDGWFLLSVARRLNGCWSGTRAVLLDRSCPVSPEVFRGFAGLGWQAEPATADVFGWLGRAGAHTGHVFVANLFLHHFAEKALATLFARGAAQTQTFIAVEPRRSTLALWFSRLVGLIGCNRVTRHDAPISVRAGFCGQELSRLWPAGGDWELEEKRAGLFSHLFVARRRSRNAGAGVRC